MGNPLSIGFASLTVTPDHRRQQLHHHHHVLSHSVAVKTDVSLSVYTATKASAIELSPSVCLFPDFAKTPIHEYARHDMEETGAGIRDKLVDSPFIRVRTAPLVVI